MCLRDVHGVSASSTPVSSKAKHSGHQPFNQKVVGLISSVTILVLLLFP